MTYIYKICHVIERFLSGSLQERWSSVRWFTAEWACVISWIEWKMAPTSSWPLLAGSLTSSRRAKSDWAKSDTSSWMKVRDGSLQKIAYYKIWWKSLASFDFFYSPPRNSRSYVGHGLRGHDSEDDERDGDDLEGRAPNAHVLRHIPRSHPENVQRLYETASVPHCRTRQLRQ